MEVGSTISSPTALLRFRSGSTIHFLRFGGELPTKRLSNPEPESRGPSQGNTAVRVTRTGKIDWRVSTGEQSTGRLSSWKPDQFVDLGLYDFSFELELTLQRLFVDSVTEGNLHREPVAK